MAYKIRIKRGLKANLPTLDVGELALCTDTGEVFVGGESENVLVNGDTAGTGILMYDTVAELQAAYPDGLDQPVWIRGEKSWYYWEGEVVVDPPEDPPADTTAPVVNISPSGGTYTSTQSVTLTANETATIYYTVDGSTPTTSSAQYTAPISISATATLKYFAKDTTGNESTIQTVNYTIEEAPPEEEPSTDLYALSFNGTNSIATSASNMTITGSQARTIEVRFKTSNIATNQTVLEWGTNSGLQSNSLCLYNQKIMLRDGTGYLDSYANAITPLASNTWYHVVFTYDGTNYVWYIDTVNRRQGAYNGVMATAATPMKYGSGSSGYLNGAIDFVRIYDRVLTSAEVTNNKNGTVVRTGLVNEWLINEGTGTTLTDAAGTNNMTSSNTAWVANA